MYIYMRERMHIQDIAFRRYAETQTDSSIYGMSTCMPLKDKSSVARRERSSLACTGKGKMGERDGS